ncbi:MAG: alkylhydroperoxidase [Sneathiella sp.]|uniref:carboxymuconolactone decarboxylase family protein n=1 Tax=Sneathiella sp. TaxID=1964365 RepID=UPI000C582DCE|nr:peroxidase-related enzyme [Sneathiella sp.]MAZ01653.1 alkylhydroperoxidase [Sneathiella sp.]
MSKIPTPAKIEDAPQASQELLKAVQKQLGSVPNLFRIVSTSPAALGGYLGLNGALAQGTLDSATRERIALAVAEYNGCDYCLAAHSYLGEKIAKLSQTEILANRKGISTDAKADAAVRFAVEVVRARGQINASAFANVKAAGYSDEEIVEIIAHVALNTLTNYINSVLGTEIDFPGAERLAA